MSTRKAVLYTCALWLLGLGACASTVKTWIIGANGLTENDTHEVLTFLQAQGYRCYSQIDDEFWRNQLATAESCCNSKSSEIP
jgi:hypothetical protein